MRVGLILFGEFLLCVGGLCCIEPVYRTDLMQKHAEKPFHALVGGGDQLYCDA